MDPFQNRVGKDRLDPLDPKVLAREALEGTRGGKLKEGWPGREKLSIAYQRLTVKMERLLHKKSNLGHRPLGFLYI